MGYLSDLNINITALCLTTGEKLNKLYTDIGDKSLLSTSNKTSLVNAINEVKSKTLPIDDPRISNWDTAYNRGDFRDYGLGRLSSLNRGTSLMNSLESGMYGSASSDSSSPISGSSGSFLHMRSPTSGNNHWSQFWILSNNSTEPRAFISHGSDTRLADWKELWHSGNFTPSDYVKKSGDTMSGALNLSGVNSGIVSDGAARPIILRDMTSSGGWARLTAQINLDGNVIDSMGHYGSPTSLNYGWIGGGVNYNDRHSIRWTGDGKVGIGLRSSSIPSEALDVIGTIKTSSHGTSADWKNAYDWGDFREFGLGRYKTPAIPFSGLSNETGFYFVTDPNDVIPGVTGKNAKVIRLGNSSHSNNTSSLILGHNSNELGYKYIDTAPTVRLWTSANLRSNEENDSRYNILAKNTSDVHSKNFYSTVKDIDANLVVGNVSLYPSSGTLNAIGNSHLHSFGVNANYGWQLNKQSTGTDLFIRTNNNKNWSEWDKFWTSRNHRSDLENDSRYFTIGQGSMGGSATHDNADTLVNGFAWVTGDNRPINRNSLVASFIPGFSSGNYGFQIGARSNDFYIRNKEAGVFNEWATVWTSKNFTAGNYYTKNESLGLFVGLNNTQTIGGTKTFSLSPIVPNATLASHAINKGQAESIIGSFNFLPRKDLTSGASINDLGVGSFYSILSTTLTEKPFAQVGAMLSLGGNGGQMVFERYANGAHNNRIAFRTTSSLGDKGDWVELHHTGNLVNPATQDWVNSRGYSTQTLTAGSNIQINGSVISATNTTYTAGTLALLNAGTDTSNRVWKANDISDFVKDNSSSLFKISNEGGLYMPDWNSVANNQGAIALGLGSYASGVNSLAMMKGASSIGPNNLNIGVSSFTNGINSANYGNYNNASRSSFTFGLGLITSTQGCTALGQYNDDIVVSPFAADSEKPALMLGTGLSSSLRYNAMIVYKDGSSRYTGMMYYDEVMRKAINFKDERAIIDIKYLKENGSLTPNPFNDLGRFVGEVIDNPRGLDTVPDLTVVVMNYELSSSNTWTVAASGTAGPGSMFGVYLREENKVLIRGYYVSNYSAGLASAIVYNTSTNQIQSNINPVSGMTAQHILLGNIISNNGTVYFNPRR